MNERDVYPSDADIVGAIRLALQFRSLATSDGVLDTIDAITQLAAPTNPVVTAPTHLLVDVVAKANARRTRRREPVSY